MAGRAGPPEEHTACLQQGCQSALQPVVTQPPAIARSDGVCALLAERN